MRPILNSSSFPSQQSSYTESDRNHLFALTHRRFKEIDDREETLTLHLNEQSKKIETAMMELDLFQNTLKEESSKCNDSLLLELASQTVRLKKAKIERLQTNLEKTQSKLMKLKNNPLHQSLRINFLGSLSVPFKHYLEDLQNKNDECSNEENPLRIYFSNAELGMSLPSIIKKIKNDDKKRSQADIPVRIDWISKEGTIKEGEYAKFNRLILKQYPSFVKKFKEENGIYSITLPVEYIAGLTRLKAYLKSLNIKQLISEKNSEIICVYQLCRHCQIQGHENEIFHHFSERDFTNEILFKHACETNDQFLLGKTVRSLIQMATLSSDNYLYVDDLILTNRPSIEKLNLSGLEFNEISDLIVVMLSPLKKHLKELKLRKCQIIDKDLSSIKNLIQITNLDLNGCGLLTDDMLKHLEKLPNLSYLDISNCKIITESGIQNLLKKLPKLTCERNSKLELEEPEIIMLVEEQIEQIELLYKNSNYLRLSSEVISKLSDIQIQTLSNKCVQDWLFTEKLSMEQFLNCTYHQLEALSVTAIQKLILANALSINQFFLLTHEQTLMLYCEGVEKLIKSSLLTIDNVLTFSAAQSEMLESASIQLLIENKLLSPTTIFRVSDAQARLLLNGKLQHLFESDFLPLWEFVWFSDEECADILVYEGNTDDLEKIVDEICAMAREKESKFLEKKKLLEKLPPLLKEFLQSKLITEDLALKLTKNDISKISNIYIKKLIELRLLSIDEATLISNRVIQKLTSLDSSIQKFIESKLLTVKEVISLTATDNETQPLSVSLIKQLIELKIITVDQVLKLSIEEIQKLSNFNDYVQQLIKSKIITVNQALKYSDEDLLKHKKILDLVLKKFNMSECLNFSENHIKALSNSYIQNLLESEQLSSDYFLAFSSSQVMLLCEPLIQELIESGNLGFSSILNLTDPEINVFSNNIIRKLLELKLITSRQLIKLTRLSRYSASYLDLLSNEDIQILIQSKTITIEQLTRLSISNNQLLLNSKIDITNLIKLNLLIMDKSLKLTDDDEKRLSHFHIKKTIYRNWLTVDEIIKLTGDEYVDVHVANELALSLFKSDQLISLTRDQFKALSDSYLQKLINSGDLTPEQFLELSAKHLMLLLKSTIQKLIESRKSNLNEIAKLSESDVLKLLDIADFPIPICSVDELLKFSSVAIKTLSSKQYFDLSNGKLELFFEITHQKFFEPFTLSIDHILKIDKLLKSDVLKLVEVSKILEEAELTEILFTFDEFINLSDGHVNALSNHFVQDLLREGVLTPKQFLELTSDQTMMLTLTYFKRKIYQSDYDRTLFKKIFAECLKSFDDLTQIYDSYSKVLLKDKVNQLMDASLMTKSDSTRLAFHPKMWQSFIDCWDDLISGKYTFDELEDSFKKELEKIELEEKAWKMKEAESAKIEENESDYDLEVEVEI